MARQYKPRALFVSPATRRIMTRRGRRAALVNARRWGGAVVKAAGPNSMYAGGAMAAAALAGYGAYRGIRHIRAVRARQRKRRQLGFRPRSLGVKNIETLLPMATKDTRTLYQHILTDVPKGTGVAERQRDAVNIKGWKITMNFQSLENVSIQTVNVAIISPKDRVAIDGTEFFRSYGSDRATDFSTALNYIQMMTNPINPDHYVILHRYRFKLGEKSNYGGTSEVESYKKTYHTLNKWIPFKRQLRYEAGGNGVESDPVYLVYWADVDFSTSGGAIETANYQVQTRFIMYFNDEA